MLVDHIFTLLTLILMFEGAVILAAPTIFLMYVVFEYVIDNYKAIKKDKSS